MKGAVHVKPKQSKSQRGAHEAKRTRRLLNFPAGMRHQQQAVKYTDV